MAHDFKSKDPYVYRKYEGETKDCRGLMDYIDDGVGWSACSARDFSRHLTNGGNSKPCLLKGNLIVGIPNPLVGSQLLDHTL